MTRCSLDRGGVETYEGSRFRTHRQSLQGNDGWWLSGYRSHFRHTMAFGGRLLDAASASPENREGVTPEHASAPPVRRSGGTLPSDGLGRCEHEHHACDRRHAQDSYLRGSAEIARFRRKVSVIIGVCLSGCCSAAHQPLRAGRLAVTLASDGNKMGTSVRSRSVLADPVPYRQIPG
jgi:hypothetical protein